MASPGDGGPLLLGLRLTVCLTAFKLLYAYFPGEYAIYVAMFAHSNRLLLERVSALPSSGEPVGLLRRQARLFLGLCVENPVRT